MLPARYLPTLLLLTCLAALLWASPAPAAGQASEAPDAPAPENRQTMTIGQAAILGVVEGLTEYLPVSSTGHLLLAERAMGIGGGTFISAEQQRQTQDATEAYTICIQAGAIVAVLGLYFRRVRQMFRGLAGRDRDGRRLLINVLVGFLPAALIGLLFNKAIKAWLFGPWPVVAAWLAGGLLILGVHWRNRKRTGEARGGMTLEELTWKMALAIGLAQCIAMWPGVSRSLITIVGGVATGMALPAAVEFSFLLGVVTLGAATAYDALKHGQEMLRTFDVPSLTVGLVFAFFSAVLAIKWMVAYLNRHGMAIFGYYRVALAVAVAVLLLTETI